MPDNVVEFNIRGLLPGLFTPLNDDHTINYEGITPYARHLHRNGFKAILVGGTTSENMCMSVAERKSLVDAWMKVNEEEDLGFHVMVQVGAAPFNDVIELTKYCASVGVHSILTLPELYFKPKTTKDLVSYIEYVSKAAPKLPLLYYHSPDMTGVKLDMVEFYKAVSEKVPSFKGIKYASNDLVEAAQVKWALRSDQVIFIAGEILLAPAALLGIDSCSSSASNIFPQLDIAIMDAVKKGDNQRAKDLQEIVIWTITELQKVDGDWIAVAKAATEYISGGSTLKLGPPCLPKSAISDMSRKTIYSIVDKASSLSLRYSLRMCF